MTTSRERGQRVRRSEERKRGKPRIGRPPGSKNVASARPQIMKWYKQLREQGYSEGVAGAVIRRQLGETMTDIMFHNWRD